jgi:methionyl-tRNA formyltransferase
MGTTLGIVCGHSQYFRKPLRLAPTMGWLNCHPSLLPLHRGPFPGFWELRAGDPESAISLHKIEASFDSGHLLAQFPIPITDGVTFSELVRRQGEACGHHAPGAIVEYLRGTRELFPQPPGGSYEPAPSGEDFVVDSAMTCAAIRSFFLGMQGVAPIFARIDGILNIIESVKGAHTGITPPAAPTRMAPGLVAFPAIDGTVTIAVRPATAADLGASASASNRLNPVSD